MKTKVQQRALAGEKSRTILETLRRLIRGAFSAVFLSRVRTLTPGSQGRTRMHQNQFSWASRDCIVA